jgi:serine/threonine protein kinase/predicted ATPase
MSPGHEPVRSPAAEDWSSLEGLIKRFVNAWRQGPRPRIDDYLPQGDSLRHAVLVELVHTDLELRLKDGEAARIEEYLARFAELAGDRAAVLELIAAEYELRRRAVPDLSLDEYRQRFPQHHGELSGQIARATLAARDTPRGRADPLLTTPPEVAGFEVLTLLGRGGMGVVYKARQRSLDRLVALKFLPEECARDPLWLERFRREALTASALNHPNICTIYDTGECAGRPFLSMELVEGQTLEALVGQGVAIVDLARWIQQAARALAAAHAAGVVHRDIKPANLMVRHDGIVKVLDFGLARRLPGGQGTAPPAGDPRTDPGTRVGTVLYMSPEQARAELVGTATDIFALGLVLYELATGQHPFLADSEFGVLHAIVSQTPLAPSRLNPEVPAALEALIQKMLAKDPRLRPTAAEVDAVLAELTKKENRQPASPSPVSGKRPRVGRRQELAALRAGFESAADGHGLMLCITGEPGLGKTTLVDDFLEELAASGRLCAIARGHCSERLAGAEAYLPFLEALDSLLQGAEGASMAQVMKWMAPAWYVQLVPLAVDDPSLAGVLAEAKGASQERLKRELGVFLQEVSRLRPLVLFLDDVHWADVSTVDLLAYLGSRCAKLRWLLVLTYRPAELMLSQHPFGPVQLELQGRGSCREIALPFLSRGDLDRYLTLAFPEHDFPEEFAAVIHARTGGNPLFIVDLLHYLRDRGILVASQQGWALAQAVPDFQRELPESVRSMIRRKMDQLSEADRHLLKAATVQGQEFDSAVVARVLGREAADVEERLEVLERVHAVVRLVRTQEFPDRTLTLRYGFVHGLYQNTLYASLQPTRKAAWSAAAAQALLDHYGEKSATVAAELALLYEAARDPARAAHYFLLAAENAVRLSANQEAAVLARRGLELLQPLPDTSERARQELPLLIVLGVSLVATKGFAAPDVEQTYVRALTLCQQAEDISTPFPVLYGLWNVYLVRCDLTRCKELAAQMFALAQDQSDPVLLLVAHNVLHQPLFHRGEFPAARHHQEQGWARYDPRQHRTLTAVYGEDPGVGCLVYGAATLWHLGYPEQALRSLEAGRRLAEELANPFNVAQALYYGAFTLLARRDVGRGQEWAGALMELCSEQDFTLLFAGGMVLHGWSLTQQGHMEEGLRQMQKGLADWQATGAVSHRPYHLALLAEALGREGRIQEGLNALDEALTLVHSKGEEFWQAELYRLQGELLLTRAEAGPLLREEAVLSFDHALNVARRQCARSLELRAAMSLNRVDQAPGQRAQARRLLAETYGWFTEGFDTLDLQEARALLEERA